MPLSDDQKAMLRLLARDQSYEDIAALMGLSVDEVVSRARGAVAQLEAEGIPAPSLPEAPAGLASAADQPAEPEPKPTPQPEDEAARPTPAEARPAAKPPPPPAPKREKRPAARNRLLAMGGGLVALVAIVALIVVLVSDGGDGDADATTAANGGDSSRANVSNVPTTAELAAVGGSGASGKAEFGRVDESLALGIEAEGLDPLPKGQVYMVWLTETESKRLPLTPVVPEDDGTIEASYQVPTEAVVYLASGEFDKLTITRTRGPALRKSLELANQRKRFPAYTGDAVLEGPIVGPIVGAAKRLEEREKREEAE